MSPRFEVEDEVVEAPKDSVYNLVQIVRTKDEEARVIEQAEPDRLTASLQPLIAESKALLKTVSVLSERHNASLQACFTIDRLTLRKYQMPESTVNALVRVAEGTHALLASLTRELQEVPGKIRQVATSLNPPALANSIRATISRARQAEQDVKDAMVRITLYSDDLAARLEHAGAPLRLVRVITSDPPRNPNAEPVVDMSGPIEADFGVSSGRPMKQAVGGPA